MKFQLNQSFQIESARFLPNLPKTHPCARTHGHSFKIVLSLKGDLDPKLGWMIDYNDISAQAKPLLAQLDHRLLNEVPGLENPTTELLCQWIYDRLKVGLPMLTSVKISETSESECIYPA